MIRITSDSSVFGGIASPNEINYFDFPEKRLQGAFSGKYVAMRHVLAQTDENIGFNKQLSTCYIQSNGVISEIQNFSTTPLVSITNDPDTPLKKCWLLRCTSSDADTAGAGAKRTELSGGTINTSPFVFGLAEKLAESWVGTSDEQIIFQIHSSLPISPIFAAYVKGGVVSIYIIHGPSVSPNSVLLYSGPIGTDWNKWVISGQVGGAHGQLTITRNNEKIVSYSGPFGFSDYLDGGYIKCGIYHWTNGGNAWDSLIPSRGIYVKGFWQADTAFVTHSQMVGFLDSV